MRVHLYTTDESALRLAVHLVAGDEVIAVVVPENRVASAKVKRLADRLGREPAVHRRGAPAAAALPAADIAISWLYSQILPPADLAAYPHGILNMHGGKIPEYRGASVLQWAIINGERELGITWHELVAEVDAGPIWAETTIPIPSDATGAEMREAMISAGIELFPQAWGRFSRRAGVPRHPSLDGSRVWPQRRPADGEIAPSLPEARLRNLVRALGHPWPPAWIALGGRQRGVTRVLAEPAPNSVPYRTAEGRVVHLELLACS
jgi:methionyl-tRNA formyltransferase